MVGRCRPTRADPGGDLVTVVTVAVVDPDHFAAPQPPKTPAAMAHPATTMATGAVLAATSGTVTGRTGTISASAGRSPRRPHDQTRPGWILGAGPSPLGQVGERDLEDLDVIGAGVEPARRCGTGPGASRPGPARRRPRRGDGRRRPDRSRHGPRHHPGAAAYSAAPAQAPSQLQPGERRRDRRPGRLGPASRAGGGPALRFASALQPHPRSPLSGGVSAPAPRPRRSDVRPGSGIPRR